MINVLLVFPYKIADNSEFEKIINDFDEQGYTIHIFNEIENEIRLESLPEIIDFVRGHLQEEIYRLVILSNVRELVFSWFRCYNSIVDDFIYFIDKEHNIFANPFSLQLASFNGIKFENIEGKIFFNLNFKNYQQIFLFLLSNDHFQYFTLYDGFDFQSKLEKKKIYKAYRYTNHILNFTVEGYQKSNVIELQDLCNDSQNIELEFDDRFYKLLIENPYFITYLAIGLYKKFSQKIATHLISLFKKLSIENRQAISNDFYEYIDNISRDFLDKTYFLSLVISLKTEHPKLSSKIMELVLTDERNLCYHFFLLVQTMFYISNDNLRIHRDYYTERRKELNRIANSYMLGCHIVPEYRKYHIAVVVDQLLDVLHSPTKGIIEYVIYLKRLYPFYSIKLFVEDNLISCQAETVTPYFYSSSVSSLLKDKHQEYFQGEDIEVYYSNPELSKKGRTRLMVKEIVDFKPEVILTTSDISPALEFLFSYYPKIYMFMAGTYVSGRADVYLHSDSDNVLKAHEKYKLLNIENVQTFKFGLTIPEPKKKFSRKDYNVNDNDFVMITVGNRLDAEMSKDFIDLICSFLIAHSDAKWFIVGNAELLYLSCSYPSLLSQQIIHINYEPDLPGLYGICDIYANPFREHGGTSILIAMNECLPILITRYRSDAIIYVGEENCSGYTLEEYKKELNQLYCDKEYRLKKGLLMKERIGNYKIENSVRELVKIFYLAKERFENRKKFIE